MLIGILLFINLVKIYAKQGRCEMDIIIQILLFPFVLPVYIYLIYMENKKEKEKKERQINSEKSKYGIYYEYHPTKNGMRRKK